MSERLRIGLAVDSFFPMIDGVTGVVDHYAREFTKQGAEVTVFAPATPGKPWDDSVFPYRVVRCKSARMPAIDYCLPTPGRDAAFRKALSETELDILHIHSPVTIGRLAMKVAKRRGIPAVCTLHSQIHRDIGRLLKSRRLSLAVARRTLRFFDEAEWWTVNRAMAKLASEDYRMPRTPLVMPNATEMESVSDAAAARREVGERYGIGPDEIILLSVGRLNILKNILLIADSLRELKAKSDLPFRMIFVGEGQDEKQLRERIRDGGVEEQTVFTGKISDRGELSRIYAAADLLLFPSLYDASSLVQIEAAAQGTPGLYVRGAVTADTITEGENGFIAENAPALYADRIAEICADPAMLARVGANARRDLLVTWEDVAKKALARYREIIAG